MPITTLGLQNFKRFDTLALDLEPPLTLLLGPNNSGKSSILRALAGLKQTASPTNDEEVFATQGEYVDLGTYADLATNHDTSKPIRIHAAFDLDERTSSILDPRLEPEGRYARLDVQVDFTYDSITERPRIEHILVAIDDDHGETATLNITRKKTRRSFWLTCNDTFYSHLSERNIYATDKLKARYSEDLKRARERLRAGVSVDHHGRYLFEASEHYRERPVRVAFLTFRSALRFFMNTFDRSVYYLGPLRGSPYRSYTQSTHIADVGPLGQYTPSVLAVFEKRAQHSTTGSKELRGRLDAFHNSLESLFPDRFIRTETYQELVKLYVERITAAKGTDADLTTRTKRSRRRKSQPRRQATESIADVGIGFSQALPILVQMAVMPKESTLIVEQPELHLHPHAQAKLAEIVAARAREGRRFIIETHSEHFLRGIQLAVSRHALSAERGIPADDVQIYYIPDPPQRPMQMPLNKAGELTTEWPSGFFDEAYRLSMELFRNKRKIEHSGTR